MDIPSPGDYPWDIQSPDPPSYLQLLRDALSEIQSPRAPLLHIKSPGVLFEFECVGDSLEDKCLGDLIDDGECLDEAPSKDNYLKESHEKKLPDDVCAEDPEINECQGDPSTYNKDLVGVPANFIMSPENYPADRAPDLTVVNKRRLGNVVANQSPVTDLSQYQVDLVDHRYYRDSLAQYQLSSYKGPPRKKNLSKFYSGQHNPNNWVWVLQKIYKNVF